mmetsp:Transcript_19772/g.38736  ORF Transcript_19772/g.38736 Transcript_19772/m.38736 type:complete len:122 (-) Transcript_19772:134-499(-)
MSLSAARVMPLKNGECFVDDVGRKLLVAFQMAVPTIPTTVMVACGKIELQMYLCQVSQAPVQTQHPRRMQQFSTLHESISAGNQSPSTPAEQEAMHVDQLESDSNGAEFFFPCTSSVMIDV